MDQLIPGLPNDVGYKCLIRVPYNDLPAASSVCQSWKSEIELPSFRYHRKSTGLTRHILVMVQLRKYTKTYHLTVYEPETDKWSELPPVPEFPSGLPHFCKIAPVGYNLVVMGGLSPDDWKPTKFVFVYNFVSATWQRGANMPRCTRSFFACASDNERKVFVAGGHDNLKNALRSGMMYDVADDVWTPLPDMADERDECKGVFHRGKFYVVSGYDTAKQGQFKKSAEAFDMFTGRWGLREDDFLRNEMCPRTCVDGGDGIMYIHHDGDVVALDSDYRMRIPSELDSVPCIIGWDGRLLAVGRVGSGGERHGAYMLDLESSIWTKVEAPEEYSGHVESGCCLEI